MSKHRRHQVLVDDNSGKAKRVIVQVKKGLGGKTHQMPPSLERTFKLATRVDTETTD